MTPRRLLLIVLPLVAGLSVLQWWPKAAISPEDEVRALVAKVITSAEKRDVASVADTLSESFRLGGGMSRQDTKQLIAGMLLRSPQGVTVLNPSLEVTIDSPATAAIVGTFVFVQGKQDIGRYEINAKLAKVGSQWAFVSAAYK